VELINKSAHIATLTNKKAELDMEIQIEQGAGYEPVEKRKRQGKLEIGTIPIDAIFTPIVRVSCRVENMRVGDRTDFNRLYLDITTDGTISPEQAFSQASEILVGHFSLLTGAFASKPEKEEKKQGNKKKTSSKK